MKSRRFAIAIVLHTERGGQNRPGDVSSQPHEKELLNLTCRLRGWLQNMHSVQHDHRYTLSMRAAFLLHLLICLTWPLYVDGAALSGS